MVKKISVIEILKKLGIKKLKPKQKEIINLFLRKDKPDTIGILPTGYGKSLCYIVPHLMKQKNVIVISPLISLMEDQAEGLRKKNISTLIFNSNHRPFHGLEGQTKYSKTLKGEISHIMYFSPESFLTNGFYIRSLLEYNRVSMVAIDECHCVSTWSDFRKDYNNLFVIKEWVNKYGRSVFVLALTATATPIMVDEIAKKLNFKNHVLVKESLYKDNLKIKIYDKSRNVTTDINKMKNFLTDLAEESKAIIYCKSRKDTETISNQLRMKHRIKCAYYHAGLDTEKRTEVQTKYRNCELRVIVATIAFGMGIDDRNIHMIIHYGISKNIESYYQEIGRGGRNGGMVDCYVFWSKRDFSINRWHIKESDADEDIKKVERAKLDDLEMFIKSYQCRMQFICEYFGDDVGVCSKCDNCQMMKVNELRKMVKEDKNTIICNFMILDTMINLNQGIGMKNLSLILKGSRSKKITPKMRMLETYGKMAHCKENYVKEKITKVKEEGFINEHDNQTGWGSYYRLNTKGNDWYLKNKDWIRRSILILEKFVSIVKFRIMMNKVLGINFDFQKSKNELKSINTDNTSTIKSRILEWRKNKATEMNLPQYCVLKNSVVDGIIAKIPRTKSQLQSIKGIGKKIMEKYGDDILKLI